MSRLEALKEFLEKASEFSEYINNSGADSAITISDPTFDVKEIGEAVDGVDYLRVWLKDEIETQERFDAHIR
tara:strand:+ start:242 stop:457 length:216 start_codon:yes stop_codon:yes gene_type:complete